MNAIWSHIILDILPPRVVTIIGGGGKTSLMYYLLKVLKSIGCAAVATTTTKLSSESISGNSFMKVKNLEAGFDVIKQLKDLNGNITLVFGEDSSASNKMVGIPKQWIDELAIKSEGTIFIVEGDGSAGKSLKGHLPYEPVIPDSSGIVIVVIGIDSVGMMLNDDNVHRSARVCELTGASHDAVVTVEMIRQLLFHPEGYLRNCPHNSVILPFINKVESGAQRQQAGKLATQILAVKHPQIRGVMMGSLLTEEFSYYE